MERVGSKFIDVGKFLAAHVALPGVEGSMKAHMEVEKCLIGETNGTMSAHKGIVPGRC